MKSKMKLVLSGLSLSIGLLCSPLYAAVNDLTVEDKLTLDAKFIPEGVSYDSVSKSYFLGSLTEPVVYRINSNKQIGRFVYDKDIVSSAGVHIDTQRRRLLVTSLDLGTSGVSELKQKATRAGIGIYSLKTAERIAFVDLAQGLSGKHLSNDIALDTDGNIYITDSFSPIIYKVDTNYKPSILIQDPEFEGEGFNLNGIVFHPDGYLIVSNYSSNSLYKVPLKNPKNWSKIELSTTLSGPDGLVLLSENKLAVIENSDGGNVSILHSTNNWHSAKLKSAHSLDSAFPTTATLAKGKLMVLDGQIDKLFSGNKSEVKNLSIYQLSMP